MAASGRGVPILPEAIPPSPDSPRAQGLGLDGVPAMAIAHIDSDQSLLSPSRAHFPPSVLGKTPSTNSTPSTGTTTAPGTGASQQDGKGPFNFQPMTLTKSPISQSVRPGIPPAILFVSTDSATSRASASVAVTSTSTAPSRTQSSSSRLRAPQSRCPRLSLSPPPASSSARVHQRRPRALSGACATPPSPSSPSPAPRPPAPSHAPLSRTCSPSMRWAPALWLWST